MYQVKTMNAVVHMNHLSVQKEKQFLINSFTAQQYKGFPIFIHLLIAYTLYCQKYMNTSSNSACFGVFMFSIEFLRHITVVVNGS